MLGAEHPDQVPLPRPPRPSPELLVLAVPRPEQVAANQVLRLVAYLARRGLPELLRDVQWSGWSVSEPCSPCGCGKSPRDQSQGAARTSDLDSLDHSRGPGGGGHARVGPRDTAEYVRGSTTGRAAVCLAVRQRRTTGPKHAPKGC
jgi:hypothetical protein